MSIKLLLADDSGVIRAGIARLLKDEPLIELVGVATSRNTSAHYCAKS